MKLTHWVLVLSLSVVVVAGPAFARRGHRGRHGGGRHEISHFVGGFTHHTHHVIEGLLLGSIIGSAIVNTIPERKISTIVPRTTRRTFRREQNGKCFLVSQNSTGDRVLTEVPASNCN
ncbi:MAG: hypothetical protein ACE5FY_02210 [Nitrospiria bacterium]